MYWINFLHIYQPPTQKSFWVKKIANESYRRLTKGLKENPKAKVTLNINAALVELFERDGCMDVVNDLKMLSERGQIDFTDSAKYHAFLPLMPEKEIERQIRLNHETNKKYFGDSYQPKGFFPTEMGYAKKVGDIAAKLGYKWIILDELALNGTTGEMKPDTIYKLKGNNDLNVFFRDRETSFRILSAEIGMSVFSSDMLVKLLGDRVNRKEYLITAMDGETFGHHRPGLEDLLFDLYKAKELESIFLSDVDQFFTKTEEVEPLDSSWALMKKDIERNTPYSRWRSDDNQIHLWQWELTNMTIAEVNNMNKQDPAYEKARNALDKAVHSDQYWWASAQPWWSIEMIEVGAKEYKDILQALPIDRKKKDKARDLYLSIIQESFEWQRSGKVEELSKLADEDVTQRITAEMPYIPQEEFDKIVGNLEKQMLTAAKAQEYERAAQIRDRVTELKEKESELTKK
ncbi:UvrB/UvrC motif-containing protein [Patescibacteria group bacterium]|nr:UvrB/UvrC motif-containing protein [Patescibacteria group bacterium]